MIRDPCMCTASHEGQDCDCCGGLSDLPEEACLTTKRGAAHHSRAVGRRCCAGRTARLPRRLSWSAP